MQTSSDALHAAAAYFPMNKNMSCL